jgi:pimeloyl-ACP methyl ester carboxylesterase
MQLAVTDTGGPGTPLVLLHGVTRLGADWKPMLPFLPASRRVIAVDQRGHGDSPRAGSYLVADYCRDAVEFVRDRLAEPVVLVGHSLGGMVAAAVAAELPDLVRAAVLEDPPFQGMGERIAGTAWQAQFIGMREAARQGGDVDRIAAHLAEIRLPAADGGTRRLGDIRDRSAIHWSAECLAKADPEVLTPVILGRWLEGYEPLDIAARIRPPVLLLRADPRLGGALDAAEADAFEAAAANCRSERFPGSGHLLHWLHPRHVAASIERFVSECITEESP